MVQANDPNKIIKQKQARQLPRQRWHQFKISSTRRQKTFNLTYEQFLELIERPCHYCNNELGDKSETGSGLDRLDSNIGYEIGNIVSCCVFYNKLKSNLLNEIEMKTMVSTIISIRKRNAVTINK